MGKRLLSLVFTGLFVIMLFTGCKSSVNISEKNNANKDVDSSLLKDVDSSLLIETVNDKTIKSSSKAFSGVKGNEQIQESVSTMDYLLDLDINNILNNTEIVVQATIMNVEFLASQGAAYTKFDILVQDSLKGGLKVGDLITVYTRGGYITMKDFIATGNHYERFKDTPQNEIDNTVIKDVSDNENFHTVGEMAIFMLTPSDNDDSELIAPKGSYWRTSGKYAELKYSTLPQSRTFSANSSLSVTRPNPDNEGETAENILIEDIMKIIK